MSLHHDWECGTTGELQCCKRCGAVAEVTMARDAYVYSRLECTDAPNVVPMTLRRCKQIRDETAARAAKMQWSPEGA
jgi:(2Fe-2S) ferredoxin